MDNEIAATDRSKNYIAIADNFYLTWRFPEFIRMLPGEMDMEEKFMENGPLG
jgi:hypothetical protein